MNLGKVTTNKSVAKEMTGSFYGITVAITQPTLGFRKRATALFDQ